MGLLASTIYDGVLVTLTFHTENCNLHYFNSFGFGDFLGQNVPHRPIRHFYKTLTETMYYKY